METSNACTTGPMFQSRASTMSRPGFQRTDTLQTARYQQRAKRKDENEKKNAPSHLAHELTNRESVELKWAGAPDLGAGQYNRLGSC
jgi:hypothetical protein